MLHLFYLNMHASPRVLQAAGRAQETASAPAQQAPVTPFARASVHRAVGEAAAAEQVSTAGIHPR